MPYTRRPLQTAVSFVVLNTFLCLSLGRVYDFVCDLPYWERRRERRSRERELVAAHIPQNLNSSESSQN